MPPVIFLTLRYQARRRVGRRRTPVASCRRCRRSSSKSRCASADISRQAAISARVRWQPRQLPLAGSIWQTETQGDGRACSKEEDTRIFPVMQQQRRFHRAAPHPAALPRRQHFHRCREWPRLKPPVQPQNRPLWQQQSALHCQHRFPRQWSAPRCQQGPEAAPRRQA